MRSKRLTGTITVRVRGESLRVLRERARRAGKTPSDLVRSVLEREFSGPEPSAWDLTRDLVGSLHGVAIGPARNARKLLKRAIADRRG